MEICSSCGLPLTPEMFKKNTGYPCRTGWISFFSIWLWAGFGANILLALAFLAGMILGKFGVEDIWQLVGIIGFILNEALLFWCAWGLWHLKDYGRKIILLSAYLMLIYIPIGTVIGILIIRYFRKPEIRALFSDEKFEKLSKEQVMSLALKIEKPPQTATIVWIVISIYLVFVLPSIAVIQFWTPEFLKKEKVLYVAKVGRDKIPATEYYRALTDHLESLSRQVKEPIDRELIEQFNIHNQILEQLINIRLLLQTAKKEGIKATPEEIKDKIMSFPAFKKDGKFVGDDEYRRFLEFNRIPEEEFEKTLSKQIIINKLMERITAGISDTKKDEFFNEYLSKLKEKTNIKINTEILERINNDILTRY
jgi:hypothetical protein